MAECVNGFTIHGEVDTLDGTNANHLGNFLHLVAQLLAWIVHPRPNVLTSNVHRFVQVSPNLIANFFVLSLKQAKHPRGQQCRFVDVAIWTAQVVHLEKSFPQMVLDISCSGCWWGMESVPTMLWMRMTFGCATVISWDQTGRLVVPLGF